MTYDPLSFDMLATTATGGFSLGVGFFAVRWLAVFVAGRWDRREAQIDEATKRLIEQLTSEVTRLAKRLEVVEHDLAECKKLHAKAEAERTRVEAILQGYGDAKQLAALQSAAEKAATKANGEGER